MKIRRIYGTNILPSLLKKLEIDPIQKNKDFTFRIIPDGRMIYNITPPVSTTDVPLGLITAPLLDDEGHLAGALVITVFFANALELLPLNTFVRTEEKHYIALEQDVRTQLLNLDLPFGQRRGQYMVTDTVTIHYSVLVLSSGERLIVGIIHNHIALKNTIQKLIVISSIFVIFFFILILLSSYLNISRLNERNKAQTAILHSLVALADWRDHETGLHLERARSYTVEITKAMRKNKKYRKVISLEFIDSIYDATPLHDIGKVGIKDAILLKKGRLNDTEFEIMKGHVLIAKQIIEDIINRFNIREPFIIMAKNIAACHHEKYNSQGYPEGVKGEAIPIEAKIFAVADVYDALRSKRSYKKALTHSEALHFIEFEQGKHFDPDVVAAFLTIESKIEKISITKSIQSTGL